MKCPYCHQEMQTGYIEAAKVDLNWTPEGKKTNFIINKPEDYQVVLSKLSWFKGAKVKVMRCPQCQIEIINEKDCQYSIKE